MTIATGTRIAIGVRSSRRYHNHFSLFTMTGCTTPAQLANINGYIEDDPDNLDGYEDLDEDDQERVRTALEEGHVADEDLVSLVRSSDRKCETDALMRLHRTQT